MMDISFQANPFPLVDCEASETDLMHTVYSMVPGPVLYVGLGSGWEGVGNRAAKMWAAFLLTAEGPRQLSDTESCHSH